MAAVPSNVAFDAARVRAIVFDLGNVLVGLDNDRYAGTWPYDMAGEDPGFRDWVAEHRLWYAYETGTLTTAELLERLGGRLRLSPKQITEHWNALLLGLLPGVVDTLEVLRKRYPLYVLSNTNETHIEWVRAHLERQGLGEFERWFEHCFYSYEMGCVKPEALIYEKAQARIGVSADQVLFVDDREENVIAASEHGWQAILMPIGAPLDEVLAPLLAEATTAG